MTDEIHGILLALNTAGWRTSMAGGRKAVVFTATHRQTGQEYVSRAPAIHAQDAVRYLAERCGSGLAGGQAGIPLGRRS